MATLKVLLRLRWGVRRWTLKHVWYRIRLRIRRRRWWRENLQITAPFLKDAGARSTDGTAVAFGEFSEPYGLGRAAAYDLQLVRAKHSNVIAIDIGPYVKNRDLAPPDLSFSVDNAYFLCQPDRLAIICRFVSPNDLRRAYRIGRWVWETPIFPEDWRFAERLVHEVWAPSEFCARVFRAALKVPVRVVPHAVTVPSDPGIDMRARLGISPEAFLGLAVMDIVSCPARKNPWDHVRVWKAAFGTDSSKVLVIKLRLGKRSRFVVDELRELSGNANNILLITNEMSNDEIFALHRSADVYVSLHRSEGFGLNIYEALLLGKPVVSTDWSANVEYGPKFAGYMPVKYALEPYKDWLGHYANGNFCWASANLDDAVRLVRKCFLSRGGGVPSTCQSARKIGSDAKVDGGEDCSGGAAQIAFGGE